MILFCFYFIFLACFFFCVMVQLIEEQNLEQPHYQLLEVHEEFIVKKKCLWLLIYSKIVWVIHTHVYV